MEILFGLAVLPAFLLMIYIRRKDKIEKEPKGLVASLFALGALTVISAALLEVLIDSFAKEIVDEGTLVYAFIEAFCEAALMEELGKFIVLKLRTWKNKEFNYTFDAVVYAVAVSLGFATLENILYVMGGSVYVAVMRGILSVPGHAIDAVFMGYYYGLAKRCDSLGDTAGKNKNLRKAIFSAVLIHGFYDFCLMAEREELIVVFFIFEIIITIVSVKKVNKLSREDSPIGPPMGVGFNQYGSYFANNPYYYDPNGYYRRYDNTAAGYNQNGYGYYQQQGYQQNYQQQAYQQQTYQQPTYQQPTYQQPVYQRQSYQRQSYQQPAYQQQTYQQPTYQQQTYQQQADPNRYNYNNYYQQTPNNSQYSGYTQQTAGQTAQQSSGIDYNSYYGGSSSNTGYYSTSNSNNNNNSYYNQ